MDSGHIEFKTANITEIGSATLNQQSAWDGIWERCKAKIGAAASEALDQQTGLSLEERSLQYHQRSAMYSSDVGAQGQAVNQIGSIATETNANMVRAIRG
jgi:hypothetical protein